jgi:hypothetical protein
MSAQTCLTDQPQGAHSFLMVDLFLFHFPIPMALKNEGHIPQTLGPLQITLGGTNRMLILIGLNLLTVTALRIPGLQH